MIRIAYFGSPSYSAEVLESLVRLKNIDIKIVVTQSDMPAGKQLALTPTPVRVVADRYNLEVFSKNIAQKEYELELISNLKKLDIDVCVLFAYSKMISDELLECPRFGFWNIHPSLLPQYRGSSPIAYCLMNGDQKTGVSIIKLVRKMDAGPILVQRTCSINPVWKRQDLEQCLTKESIEMTQTLLQKPLESVLKNALTQIESQATYTRKIHRNDGYIPAPLIKKCLLGQKISIDDLPAIQQSYFKKYRDSFYNCNGGEAIFNLYRALYPWPGLWTKLCIDGTEKRVKLRELSYDNGRLNILTVQLEGKLPVDFMTFKKGYSKFMSELF